MLPRTVPAALSLCDDGPGRPATPLRRSCCRAWLPLLNLIITIQTLALPLSSKLVNLSVPQFLYM